MDELEIVKRNSGWKDVERVTCSGFKVVFQSPRGEISPIDGMKYFYTGGLREYIIAVGASYYLGFWNDAETIYCFAEFDSLEEACSSL